MIFEIPQHCKIHSGLEKEIGEYLEIKLEKSGFEVTLPTEADWGYVFRIKYDKHFFDIIIKLLSETEMSVSIDSALKLFGKILPDNDAIEKKALEDSIASLFKNYWI